MALRTLIMTTNNIIIISNPDEDKLKVRSLWHFMKTVAKSHTGEFHLKKLDFSETSFKDWYAKIATLSQDTENIFDDKELIDMFDVLWEEAYEF